MATPDGADLDRKIVVSDDRRRMLEADYWLRPGTKGGRDLLSVDQLAQVDAVRRKYHDKYGQVLGRPTTRQAHEINQKFSAEVLAVLTPDQVAAGRAAVDAALPTGRQALIQQSASHLHQIGLAILLYQQDNGQKYPPDLGTLVRDEQIGIDVFTCPGTANVAPADAASMSPADKIAWVSTHSDYTYIRPATNAPDEHTAVCYETGDYHQGRGKNILYGDGHVALVPLANAARQIDAARATASR